MAIFIFFALLRHMYFGHLLNFVNRDSGAFNKLELNANTFHQKLSHFSTAPTSFFNQRYYVQSYGNQPLNILYIGGEGPLRYTPQDDVMTRAAKQLHGTVYALEHRGYGYADDGTFPLSFVSIDEAVEDLAYFATSIASNQTWVLVGGSYSGSLSHATMLKYSHIFKAAISSSAPLHAQSEYPEYDEAVSKALTPDCRNHLESAIQQLDDYYSNNPSKFQYWKSKFTSNYTISDVSFFYVLADTVAFAVQYNSNKLPYLNYLCEQQYSQPSVANYKQFPFSKDAFLEHYVSFVHMVFGYQSLPNWDMDNLYKNQQMRLWMYQSCTSFGWFQTAPKSNSIRSKFINLEWHLNHICYTFYPELKPRPNTETVPRTNDINKRYAALKPLPSVIYTNGNDDPWSVLSIKPNKVDELVQFGDKCGAYAYVISKGSHCNDLYPFSKSDTAAQHNAKLKILQVLLMLIQEC